MKTCLACQRPSDDDAVFCKHCGGVLGAPETATTSPPVPTAPPSEPKTGISGMVAGYRRMPPKDQKRVWTWVAVGVGVLFVVIASVVGGGSSTDDDIGATVDGAYDVCQTFVERQLQYPGSSEFQDIVEADVSVDGDDATVIAYVDAANGFGAKSRRPYVCDVSYTGDGEWTLENLDIDLS